MNFIDTVKATLNAGDGGNGCVSVKREKYKPLAGVDGGDGGDGGSIIIKTDSGLSSLYSIHINKVINASNGRIGKGSHKNGENGKDIIIKIPIGTIVKDINGKIIHDFNNIETNYTICKGGVGGKGNFWISKKTKSKGPKFALKGTPGEKKTVIFEYNAVSDAALVGFPNAGKSSLVSSITNSKSKVANYPFTTLVPQLGTINLSGKSFTLADIPGIIKDASEGKGLGLNFLKHITRSNVLVFVIDIFDYKYSPYETLITLKNEISKYNTNLIKKPSLVALTKTDIDIKSAEIIKKEMKKKFKNDKFILISSVTHFGLKKLIYEIYEKVLINKKNTKKNIPEITLTNSQKKIFEITKVKTKSGKNVFYISGEKPLLWSKQTYFENSEAVNFYNDRLEKSGINHELEKQGIEENDIVRILENNDVYMEFNWLI